MTGGRRFLTIYARRLLRAAPLSNKSVDTFSFALLLLEIVVGDALYVKSHWPGRFAFVKGWRPPFPPALAEEQPELVALIEQCWAQDPSSRPDFNSIEARLAALRQEQS